jgi:thiamine-phosphate pyrophosphorylase
MLGINGYAELVAKMTDSGIDLPLIAVGGIKTQDTEPLFKTGIHGIAVSASVNLSDDPAEAIRDFYKKIY